MPSLTKLRSRNIFISAAVSRIGSGKDRSELLPVVDWDGTPLDPQDPKAFEKIVAAVERGGTASLGSNSEST